MADSQSKPSFREEWSLMTLGERFEQSIIVALTATIMVTVVSALWALLKEVWNTLILGGFDSLGHESFQVVFGMIFTVVIALEFKRSLLVAVERRFGIVQVRSIVLIALLAIVRKFIIIDLSETSPAKIAALAGAVLTLGAVFWLVREQDAKERTEFSEV